MEILKLAPAFKDYLWGGLKLVEQYNKKSDLAKVAESWEMSNHKDGSSTIISNARQGQSFRDYLEEVGKDAWGTKAAKYDSFPIMIKFIDAKQALSIQVHPDDEYALKYEGEFGKNEFWYVLEAEPDAFLYYGVNQDMTREEFKEYIDKGVICDYLKKVEVKKGDCFYIETGTIHAIGAGIVIAEIQQCSNSTYRVFDFNRLGVDGKPRELHIDKAVAVSKLTPNASSGEPDGTVEKYDGFEKLLLTDNSYFNCTKYDVTDCVKLEVTKESFQALIILEGQGTIFDGETTIELIKGDSIFIPAQSGQVSVAGTVSFIQTQL